MKKQGKKILIGVLITIMIGGLIFVFILNSCNQSNSIYESNIISITSEEDKNDNEYLIFENELIEENIESINVEQDNKEEQIVVKTETSTNNAASILDKDTSTNKDNTNIQKNNIEIPKNDEINDQTPKGEKVHEENKEPSISQVQNNEQVQETQQEENTKEESEDKKENTNQPSTEEIPEVKEETKEEVKQEEVYSYKYNATMTEQIRQDIINNESEYMKKNGYTIKIDESIVDLTNQFTYTAERVKSKIVKKFGTIRIYARDFYYNGSYLFTECYII